MDELEIGGKKYISSKRAAREHRYHIDYIGQLIRGGKIVGKKIGRSWYVEDLSLKNYLRMESGLDPITEEVSEEVSSAETATTSSEVETNIDASIAEITMKNIDISESKDGSVYAESTEFLEEEISETEDVIEEITEVRKEFTVKPIVLGKVSAAAEEPKKTLNYVRDTEPLIPTLDRKVRENADFMPINLRKPAIATLVLEETVVKQEVPTEDSFEQITVEERPYPRKKGKVLKFAALAVFIAILLIGAAASTLLSTKINVSDSGTANVRLSLP